MGRYVNEVYSSKTQFEIMNIVEGFFIQEGFEKVLYKGYEAYKKGHGIMTAPQFVSVFVNGNVVHIEAWLRWPILPGVYVGEMGIHGMMAALPKKFLRDRVMMLEQIIM